MRNRSGLIGCFAVCIVMGIVITAVFVWIDISRISYLSWHLQASLDAAVLAGAQHLPGDNLSAIDVAKKVFYLNETTELRDDRTIQLEFSVTGDDDSVLLGRSVKKMKTLAALLLGNAVISASAKASPINCVDTPYPHVLPPEIAAPTSSLDQGNSFKSTILID